MKSKQLFILVLAVSALCGSVRGEESRLSLTASAGASYYTLYRDQYRLPQFGTTGNAPTITSVRDHDISYQLGVGFRITEQWSADIGWIDGGTIRVRGIAPIDASSAGAFSTGIHQKLWKLGASYVLPGTDRIKYVARAGYARWKNTYENRGVPITGLENEDGNSPYLGLGLSYDWSPNINLGLDYTYQAGHQQSSRVSGALSFRF